MFSWKQHRNSASNGRFQSRRYFLKRRFAVLQVDAGVVFLMKRRVPDSRLAPLLCALRSWRHVQVEEKGVIAQDRSENNAAG